MILFVLCIVSISSFILTEKIKIWLSNKLNIDIKNNSTFMFRVWSISSLILLWIISGLFKLIKIL